MESLQSGTPLSWLLIRDSDTQLLHEYSQAQEKRILSVDYGMSEWIKPNLGVPFFPFLFAGAQDLIPLWPRTSKSSPSDSV